MNLFEHYDRIINTSKIQTLISLEDECNSLQTTRLNIKSDIHYLLGKYKSGVLTNIIKRKEISGTQYNNELKFTRTGLRLNTFYRSGVLSIEELKVDFKNPFVIHQLNNALKPEGQKILKKIIKYLEICPENNPVKLDNFKKEIYPDKQLIPHLIGNKSINITEKSQFLIKYDRELYIELNDYTVNQIRNNMEGITIRHIYYKEIKNILLNYKRTLIKYNKVIECKQNKFNKLFSKYLVLKTIMG